MNAKKLLLADALLRDKTGRGVRIGVVDSGIAPGHPHIGAVSEGTSVIYTASDTLDRIGHGTAVAAAIREKAPDAELVPVKVFDRVLRSDSQTLSEAIVWSVDHGCHLVNLSLGTSNTEHAGLLMTAVRYATERGVLVVAAYESQGARWLPGSLDGVIGVTGSADMDREALYIIPELCDGVLRMEASIYPRPIPGVPRERNLHGISFAVANTTGFVARLVEGRANGVSVAGMHALATTLTS